MIVTELSPTTTFYMDNNGKLILAANQHQRAVIEILVKLGLKNLPHKGWYTFTIPATKWYTGSFSSNSATLTFSDSPTTGTDLVIPEPEAIKMKGFSRDEKKNWRDKWKVHSKNTGHRK